MPIEKATPGLFHPLSVCRVLKTNSLVLRFASANNVDTMETKKMKCKIPPIVSRWLIIFRSTRLIATGIMISVIRNRVACHAFGS